MQSVILGSNEAIIAEGADDEASSRNAESHDETVDTSSHGDFQYDNQSWHDESEQGNVDVHDTRDALTTVTTPTPFPPPSLPSCPTTRGKCATSRILS